jgi:hypothetical protein
LARPCDIFDGLAAVRSELIFIMEDDPKIIHSPLCRRIKRNRTTVEVLIYRGEDESDWILEVEDESGGSTVWTETFASDTAALEEVMSVIKEEGIEIFLAEDGKTVH